MKWMIIPLICSLFVLAPQAVQSQDLIGKQEVDSAFVRSELSDWSLRFFSTFKYQSLVIREPDAKVRYRPVDPFNAGVGFSYKTWVLDIGFRINSNSDHKTKRFDFSTSALIGPHMVDLGFMYYKGFEEITANFDDPFRDDVQTLTMNLDYLYFPNFKKVSYAGSRTGLGFQKKGIGSPLIGGFAERHIAKGDSSLAPADLEIGFNETMQFSQLNLRSAGMLFGYAQFHPITDNLYGAAIITTGIGAYWGSEKYEFKDNNHVSGAMFQINLYAALGYNWKRVYAIINYGLDNRYVGFGHGMRYNYYIGRLKLAAGYKFLK